MSAPRRVVVTGGSGFIGTNLVERFARTDGVEVTNLDDAAPRHSGHGPLWRRVDLCSAAQVAAALEETAPDVVVHLAARTDLGSDDVADYSVNTEGVRILIEAAASAGVQRVLFASSQLVCEPGHRPVDEHDYCPPNAYGRSKVVGEELVRELAADRFTWVLIRPTTIWGPWWGPLYSQFFRTVRAGRYLHPAGVEVHKSFGFVDNAIDRLVTLCELPHDDVHTVMLYLSDDEPYPVREWASEIAAEFGARPVRQVPLWVLRSMAAAGDLTKRLGVTNPPISSYRLRNMCTGTSFDMEPLITRCGPQRVQRAEGTRRTVEWMQQR